MTTISLKLLATYRSKLPEGSAGNTCLLEVSEDSTVGDILAIFDVPADQSSVILVNGYAVQSDAKLADGDEVCVYSAIAGG